MMVINQKHLILKMNGIIPFAYINTCNRIGHKI
jgi:hypothetical protein